MKFAARFALVALTTVATMIDAGRAVAQTAALSSAPTVRGNSMRIIVGQSTGGATDMLARMLAKYFTDASKQYAIVENHAGAAGSIAIRLVAQAQPDGYTLLLSTAGPISINPILRHQADLHPARALAPIVLLATSPHVLVVRRVLPVTNVNGLIAFAKKNPGRLRYGVGDMGSSSRLIAEMFKSMTAIHMVRVPFIDTGPSLEALMSDQVDLTFATLSLLLPHLSTGRLNALAVTAPRRSTVVPHLPTIAEAGLPGFEAQQWFALFGPATLPQNTIHKLNAEISHWLASAEVRKRFAADGMEPGNLKLQQLSAFMRDDAEHWMRVIKGSGVAAN